MPSIQHLHDELPKDQFIVLTVLYNDDPNLAGSMAAQIGADFPIAIDSDSRAARSYGLTGVPETYIIDQQGILREKIVGAVPWDSPRARQVLDQYLSR